MDTMVSDAAWGAIQGAYDLQVHVSPDVIPRRIDDVGGGGASLRVNACLDGNRSEMGRERQADEYRKKKHEPMLHEGPLTNDTRAGPDSRGVN